jgi:hypothetical protein
MNSNLSSFTTIYSAFVFAVSNSSVSQSIQNYTRVRMNLFLTMTDTVISQNIDLSSLITLYMSKCFIKSKSHVWEFKCLRTHVNALVQ